MSFLNFGSRSPCLYHTIRVRCEMQMIIMQNTKKMSRKLGQGMKALIDVINTSNVVTKIIIMFIVLSLGLASPNRGMSARGSYSPSPGLDMFRSWIYGETRDGWGSQLVDFTFPILQANV